MERYMKGAEITFKVSLHSTKKGRKIRVCTFVNTSTILFYCSCSCSTENVQKSKEKNKIGGDKRKWNL